MPNKLILRSLIVSVTLLINGCHLLGSSENKPDNPVTVTKTSGPWLERKQRLENLHGYQARGKFAYITANKTTSANFAWYQRNINEYRLSLTTPFGNRVVELNVTPNLTQLTDDKNQIHINADAQTLIYQLTGMNIPLNNLRQWLIGLPGESMDYQLDKDYRLSQLHFIEDGLQWQVKYLGYSDATTPNLPSDLELYQGDHKIKIRVSNWELQ